jgi:hypothetical protein
MVTQCFVCKISLFIVAYYCTLLGDTVLCLTKQQSVLSSLSLNELPKARKYVKTVSSVISMEIRVDVVCQKSSQQYSFSIMYSYILWGARV